ncbi:oxygen-independent coproporphyrinogen III oxidase [Palleronia sp. KMU-117]|uniref:oxygen-independent coproporphyrinogen III oxidase n=1 Tax=Palleronia sp. KMU-117 TaxID=3434108 RepID=UPI003D74F858
MERITQLRRLGLFDARVPRYTSYPTANHFAPSVGPREMGQWIMSIAPDSQISLYLHIPFCRRLCWFCACRTQGTASAKPLAGYLETLKRELRMVSDKLPQGVSLGRLHWGGGTPTLLAPDMIRDLAGAVTAAIPFAEGAEFSVEIDPNEIDAARLDALAEMGMNRASIGVQDFDDLIQKTIGRPQSFDITKEAVDMLRDRGIRSLNIDLLYGLPHQTDARIADSVQKVLSLSPDRVALYGYAHVPWMARRQSLIPTEALPAPEARLGLYDTARELFLWDGYAEIGIDHFARPGDGLEVAAREGRLRRNFQGYTDDQFPVLLGLGASAISRFPGGYAQNAAATSKYQEAIQAGRLATVRGHVFSDEDILRSAIIEDLMCAFAVDYAAVAARTGREPREVAERLKGVEAAFPGMLGHSADGLTIRPEAHELARMIARYVDAYAASDGHSSAI